MTEIQGRAFRQVHETREEKMEHIKNGQTFKRKKIIVFFAAFAITLGTMLFVYHGYAKAAGNSVSVVAIDYDAETITIKANPLDTQIYYSNKSQSTWDTVYGKIDSKTHLITMDISWISKTSSYVLSLKGDKSTTPITVVLPKQVSSFRVSLDYTTNIIRFMNYGEAKEVYWRKENTTVWNTIRIDNYDDIQAFQNDVERFSLQGITLYFRLGQVPGTSETDTGSRPSKETTLKITKRATAPSINADFAKGIIPIKSTMEYKDASSEEWINAKTSTLDMKDIAALAYYSETNKEPKDVMIDIRLKATMSKVASGRTTITIPAQEITKSDNIEIEYIGSTQCKLNITKKEITVDGEKVTLGEASTTNPYEYTIVKVERSLEDSATWVEVTSPSVVIKEEDAPAGSKIFIRKKATATSLPSVPYKTTIGGYPSASSVENVELKKVSGVDTTFSFALTVPTKDTTISSIKFNGTDVTFTTKKAKFISESNMYAMDVTITSVADLEAISSNLDTTLTAVITLSNGEVIREGVTLYISPATTIVEKKKYEKYLDITLDENIEFVLDLNSVKKEGVTVSKITYNNQDVEFNQIKDTQDLEIRVIISNKTQFDKIEDTLTFAKLGTEIPFVITLSSEEVISTGITLNVKPIVTTTSSSSGFGVSAGAYLAALETESTSDDIANPVISLTIDKGIYEKYDLILSDVKWNDKEIMGSYTTSDNETKLTLSIANMIDELNFTSSSSFSDFVKVTLKKKSGEVFKTIITNYKITVVR